MATFLARILVQQAMLHRRVVLNSAELKVESSSSTSSKVVCSVMKFRGFLLIEFAQPIFAKLFRNDVNS